MKKNIVFRTTINALCIGVGAMGARGAITAAEQGRPVAAVFGGLISGFLLITGVNDLVEDFLGDRLVDQAKKDQEVDAATEAGLKETAAAPAAPAQPTADTHSVRSKDYFTAAFDNLPSSPEGFELDAFANGTGYFDSLVNVHLGPSFPAFTAVSADSGRRAIIVQRGAGDNVVYFERYTPEANGERSDTIIVQAFADEDRKRRIGGPVNNQDDESLYSQLKTLSGLNA